MTIQSAVPAKSIMTCIPFDALEIGMEAEIKRLCRAEDFLIFATASGNHNPAHLPISDHEEDEAHGKPVAPSMWVASLISSVLGNKLPGPGTLYKAQTLKFLGRAYVGDELTIKVRLVAKGQDRLATFATSVCVASGFAIVEGIADVIAPANVISYDASGLPGLTVQRHLHFDALLESAEPLPALKVAVVAPEAGHALAGALLAAKHTLIDPLLIGHRDKILAAAAEIGADPSTLVIEHADNHDLAAARAVELVHSGKVHAIMKGHMHTEDLLHHVVKSQGGLRTSRRLSHVFVMDVPGLDHLLAITDAAINIAPDLEAKMDIVQNAIDLMQALGVETPKVAILSAVETVNPKIPSTLEAAALSKMAERGQITGGLVDGPLAMDNAVSLEAAATKGIHSSVAGLADILVAPNLESGNMIAKQLTFLAHAEAGGIVIGGQCPIILTSRSDDEKARLASCAIAALYHQWTIKK